MISAEFKVLSGVRQGGILSPVLFNLYVDDLFTELQLNGDSCYVGMCFIGCSMYADDLLLLSPSIIGLQRMLDTCSLYGTTHNIMFNISKRFSVAIGRMNNHIISAVCMDNQPIPRVDHIKYLRVTFDASC